MFSIKISNILCWLCEVLLEIDIEIEIDFTSKKTNHRLLNKVNVKMKYPKI